MRRLSAVIPLVCAVLTASPTSAAGTYTQENWFVWDTRTLDVLIFPPSHGQLVNGNGLLGGAEGGTGEATPFNSYLRAIEASVADWGRAIQLFGSTALRASVVINVYVVGRDVIPGSALADPEIVVTTEPLGAVRDMAAATEPCLAVIPMFGLTSYTYADMYNVSGHRYGHCLGLGHAFGSPNDAVITHDVMYATDGHPPGSAGTHKHCVSNLNVLGLERAFALFGNGGDVTMAATSYARIC